MEWGSSIPDEWEIFKHSGLTVEECGKILNHQPESIKDATTEFVKKMAFGGTRDQESLIVVPGQAPPANEAQETLKMAHSKTAMGNTVEMNLI